MIDQAISSYAFITKLFSLQSIFQLTYSCRYWNTSFLLNIHVYADVTRFSSIFLMVHLILVSLVFDQFASTHGSLNIQIIWQAGSSPTGPGTVALVLMELVPVSLIFPRITIVFIHIFSVPDLEMFCRSFLDVKQ